MGSAERGINFSSNSGGGTAEARGREDRRGHDEEEATLDFMYAAPPGLKKDDDPEPEPERRRRVERRPVFNVHAAAAGSSDDRIIFKTRAGATGCDAPFGKANEGYDLLPDDEDDAFLASLSTKEKRSLLKRLRGNDDDKTTKKKRKKKKKSDDDKTKRHRTKKKKKKRDSRDTASSSSSSSDDDDSGDDRDRRK